ncbi:MAG: hypothetical protein OEV55_03165 [candidate division Zixibacteria bacterium]|nr:hypothetical protein [candidate division Zixibacteria bacterium]
MLKRNVLIAGVFIVSLLVFSPTVTVFSQNYTPGELIIVLKNEYLPLNPVVRNDSLITNLRSLDSLNAFFKSYELEKIYKGKWSAIQSYYLLRFPDNLDVIQMTSTSSKGDCNGDGQVSLSDIVY